MASAALDVEGHLLRFDEPTTVQKLKSAGIEAVPLGRYAQRHSQGPGLVMGFAPFNEEEIDRAAQRVAAALREAV